MPLKKNKVNRQSFFKKIPKNCDNYFFACKASDAHFVITGPCQLVIRKRKGNWVYCEVLKDKNASVIKSPRNLKEKSLSEE